MTIINPTINLVARPNMTLPSPWVFSREATTVSSNFNFAGGSTNSDKITNASRGTFITPLTYLGYVERNVPRQDFSASLSSVVAGQYNGMLIESPSYNILLTGSNSIDTRDISKTTSGWASIGSSNITLATVTSKGLKDTSSVSGLNTCTKVTSTATSYSSKVVYVPVTGLSPNKNYSLSCYVNVNSGSPSVSFVHGPTIPTSTSTLLAIGGGTCTDPNNWVRLTGKFSTPSPVSTYYIGIKFTDSNNFDLNLDFIQLEEGNATSTILTGSKIRVADELYIPGSSLASKIDPFEGTLYCQFKLDANSESISGFYNGLFNLGTDVVTTPDSVPRISAYRTTLSSGNTQYTARVTNASGPLASCTYTTPVSPSVAHKLAVSYRYGFNPGLVLAVDGDATVYADLSSDTAGLASVITSSSTEGALQVGRARYGNNSQGFLDGTLLHFAYFPKALSAADLATITRNTSA